MDYPCGKFGEFQPFWFYHADRPGVILKGNAVHIVKKLMGRMGKAFPLLILILLKLNSVH